MHPPYNLFEFTLESFRKNGLINGYELIFDEFYVINTFLPAVFDKPLKWWMKKNQTGMQMMVWLRKIN